MRRFDAPLLWAKAMLDKGAIGAPFKIVSILEDPVPPPEGYNSSGILSDMAVHNIDEILWLGGQRPERLGRFWQSAVQPAAHGRQRGLRRCSLADVLSRQPDRPSDGEPQPRGRVSQ